MRSYARHSGSSTSIEVLRRDLSENSGTTLAENTVSRYLEELRQIFVIEDIPAWNPNLRSKTAIRTANTRYFSDSSIGVAALGIGRPHKRPKQLRPFLRNSVHARPKGLC